MRCQKELKNAESNKVESKFSENIPTESYGYALVLANNITSISSDG